MRKESEICQKPFEKELRDLDLLLENSLLSRRDSPAGSVMGDVSDIGLDEPMTSLRGDSRSQSRGSSEVGPNEELTASGLKEQKYDRIPRGEDELVSANMNSNPQDYKGAKPGIAHENYIESVSTKHSAAHQHPTPEDSNTTPPISNGIRSYDQRHSGVAHESASNQTSGAIQHLGPPTPPLSSGGDLQPLSNGGIPWYMDPFDPDGTTIQEERWTGRELVRGMSEELSDMDEEELSGLVDSDMADNAQCLGTATLNPDAAGVGASRRKAAAKRKRWRGYR